MSKESKFGEVVGDFGAGPILCSDELAPDDAVTVDDVGFRDHLGTVERVDATIRVADGEEIDVVLSEEVLIDIGILVGGDTDDRERRIAALEGEQAGEFFDAGGAPGCP